MCLRALFDDVVERVVGGLEPRGRGGAVVGVALLHAQHDGRSKGHAETLEATKQSAARQPAAVDVLRYLVERFPFSLIVHYRTPIIPGISCRARLSWLKCRPIPTSSAGSRRVPS